MSALVALLLGLGVFLVFDGVSRRRRPRTSAPRRNRLAEWLAECGAGHVRPAQFVGACTVLALAAAAATLAVIGSLGVALVASAAAGAGPSSYYRRRRRSLRADRRRAWPDAVDLLAGAVRMGDTLPAAIGVVAERGPGPLRPVFAAVVRDHRVSGDLARALERMGATVGDPVADRVTRTLVLAHRVGGRELGRLLRTLGEFLRQDLANRREIASRQSWIVVAARVAAVAPWLVLVLVASRPQGAGAFDSATGVAVLVVGAGVTIVGYRLMLRIGHLPDEPRVLAEAST
jgi:tight adherence protein B